MRVRQRYRGRFADPITSPSWVNVPPHDERVSAVLVGVWHCAAHQGKLTNVDPVIIASARKHRVHDDDILHAYRQPVRVLELDDLIMLIGPSRSGKLLEVGVSRANGIDFIIHAMPARPKFIR